MKSVSITITTGVSDVLLEALLRALGSAASVAVKPAKPAAKPAKPAAKVEEEEEVKPVPAPKPKPKPKPKPVPAPKPKPIVYIDERPEWYDAPLHDQWWNFGEDSASDKAEERVFGLYDDYRESIEGMRVDVMLDVFWVETDSASAAMIIGKSIINNDTFAVRYEKGHWRMATFSGGALKSESTFPYSEEDGVIKAMLNV